MTSTDDIDATECPACKAGVCSNGHHREAADIDAIANRVIDELTSSDGSPCNYCCTTTTRHKRYCLLVGIARSAIELCRERATPAEGDREIAERVLRSRKCIPLKSAPLTLSLALVAAGRAAGEESERRKLLDAYCADSAAFGEWVKDICCDRLGGEGETKT